MSFTINPNYFGGEFNQGLFLPRIKQTRDLGSGLWRVVNAKDLAIVPVMSHESYVQSGSNCSLTPTTSNTIAEKRLDLIQLGIRHLKCKDELIRSNYALQMARGVYNDDIVAPVLNAIASYMADTLNNTCARLRWVGSVAGGDAMDGLVTKLQAAGAYNITTNPTGYRAVTAGTINDNTVIGEIQKVIDATPVEVRFSPGFKLVISPAVFSAYQAAAAKQNAFATWGVGNVNDPMSSLPAFIGYFAGTMVPMFVIPQLTSTLMIAGNFEDSENGNIVLATDLLLDFGNVIVFDKQTVNPLDTQIEFGMAIRQAVDFMDASQIALYI